MNIESFILESMEIDNQNIDSSIQLFTRTDDKILKLKRRKIFKNTIEASLIFNATMFKSVYEINQYFDNLFSNYLQRSNDHKSKIKINAVYLIKHEDNWEKVYSYKNKNIKINYSFLDNTNKEFNYKSNNKVNTVITQRYKFLLSEIEKEKIDENLRKEISSIIEIILVVMNNNNT